MGRTIEFVSASGFQFTCSTCDEIHEGVPAFIAPKPYSYFNVPERERDQRCDFGDEECVIDEEFFFVRGNIKIPVHGLTDKFVWTVWVSLSKTSFHEWIRTFDDDIRSGVGPFFGWLNTEVPGYTGTINLKTMVHLQDYRTRPLVILDPSDHLLSIDQHDGIGRERACELVETALHG